jgi:hypothetical protein
MKRQVIVIIAVVLIILLATVRLVFKTKNKIEFEKLSYIRSLNYDFSAQVDSIIPIGKNGKGFLVCRLTEGNVNPIVEDHLNQQLTHYKWMRFLFFKQDGQPQIFLEHISIYRAGDSVRVNSSNDKLAIYRKGSTIFESAIADATWQRVSYRLW